MGFIGFISGVKFIGDADLPDLKRNERFLAWTAENGTQELLAWDEQTGTETMISWSK